ncbi:MAG: protein kinase [Myxococcales bacterium]|nr:protein kinase [Myxococcales bacterium]MCB9749065.1 protein kinase [Myxococcales bacterium]
MDNNSSRVDGDVHGAHSLTKARADASASAPPAEAELGFEATIAPGAPGAAPEPTPFHGAATLAASVTRSDAAPTGALHRIGRYAILSKLGEGGMGEVLSAYDEELERRVAIKLVHSRLGDDSLGRSRMQREAQAMAQLSHPNVVQVHDVGEHEGRVFIAMEYVKGETLRAWQRRLDPTTPAARRQLVNMYVQAGQGLLAAHARDIVHRDFKPDNVLVGLDGRPRVLDFGLAAAGREQPRARAERDARADTLTSSLTRTGSVMGTPAYMAPEQFLALETDGRTDQFSFCVSLYEALYGELPFAGANFDERRYTVTEGVRRAPPSEARVPAWLHAKIIRGLATAPEDRYPDMGALLKALADDPDLLLARRARLLLGVVVVAAVSVALLFAGLELAARWREHSRQADALARLAELDGKLDTMTERGELAEARRVFARFVENPQNRDTAALGRAWLRQAERERAAGDEAAAIDAYASAYTLATSPRDQVSALIELSRYLRAQERWDEFCLAVETLTRRAAELVDDPRARALRFEAAVARRELSIADGLAPGAGEQTSATRAAIVRALAPATPTELRALTRLKSDRVAWGSRDALVFSGYRDSRTELIFTGVEPSLPRFDSFSFSKHQAHVLEPAAGSRPLLVANRGGVVKGAVGALQSLERGSPTDVFTWDEHLISATLSHDFDGDGLPEFYVGTGPYTRHLRELVPPTRAGAPWSIRAPAPELDARQSDVARLLAGDLDGDGEDELVAALGPWNAYELHVFRYDRSRREFSSIARRQYGNVPDAALVRRARELPLEIAFIKSDDNANQRLFADEHGVGATRGLYLLALQNDRLVQTAFVPTPPRSSPVRLFAGDLDGDGLEELVVAPQDQGAATHIYATAPGGALEPPLALRNLHAVGVHDLDGDGDDELIASLRDLPDAPVWVLGAGEQTLPMSPARSPAPSAHGRPRAAALATVWEHTSDLVKMGLREQAAVGFETLAAISEDELEWARARYVAGSLREGLHQDQAAAELYRDATLAPALREEATLAAARSFVRRGDYDEAARLLTVALTTGAPLSQDARARVTRTLAELERLRRPDAVYSVTGERPLDPGWSLARPLLIRRDRFSRALNIDAEGTQVIAARAMTWSGGHVAIEVEAELLRAEWATALQIALVPSGVEAEDVAPLLAVQLATRGGTQSMRTTALCRAEDLRVFWQDADGESSFTPDRRRVRIRVALEPDAKELTCRITSVAGEELFYERQSIPARAEEVVVVKEIDARAERAVELVLSSEGVARNVLSTAVRSVQVLGATPTAASESPSRDARARALLVEGAYDDALGVIATIETQQALTGELLLWRAVARAEQHERDEATVAFAPVLERAALDASLYEQLLAQLHVRPQLFPIISRAGGAARGYSLVSDAWRRALFTTPNANAPARAVLESLRGFESLELPPEARLRYLAMRAHVLLRLDLRERARRDLLAQRELLARVGPDFSDGDDFAPSLDELEFQLAELDARDGRVEEARARLERIFSGARRFTYADLSRTRPALETVLAGMSMP